MVLLWFPYTTQGAVLINEIAWMGKSVDANDEWIELYNDGTSEVSLDGWVLTDNVSLVVALAGTVGAGEYVVLERTDDTTVPEVSAFFIYKGALSNEGRTLSLKHQDGTLEDQIAGGENWESVGGDNVTKDTAQRTLEDGWITGTPTPGRVNVSTPSTPTEQTNSDENDEPGTTDTSQSLHSPALSNGVATSKRSSPQKIQLSNGEHELTLSVTIPDVIYENQVARFSVEPRGAGKAVLSSLSYAWNFGDTYTSTQKNPTHAFAFPGTYVLVLEAQFAKQHALLEKQITVLPVTLSLSRDERGNILVQNDAPYTTDISGFVLYGTHPFTLPKNTKVPPRGTLIVDARRIGVDALQLAYLYDAEGNRVTTSEHDVDAYAITNVPNKTLIQSYAYTETKADADVVSIATSSPEARDDIVTHVIPSFENMGSGGIVKNEKYKYLAFIIPIILILILYVRRI